MEKVEIFENTKKFCKHWWRVYRPMGIEYCDYEQECAVLFFEKLVFYSQEEAIAISSKRYKYVLLQMIYKNKSNMTINTNIENVGCSDNCFLIDDIGLTTKESFICKGLIDDETYIDMDANRQDILGLRKKVGDYFEIDDKHRGNAKKNISEIGLSNLRSGIKKIAHLGREKSIQIRQRKMNMIDNGIVIKTFLSLKEAAFFIDKTPGGIRSAIRHNCKCGGYNWQYA